MPRWMPRTPEERFWDKVKKSDDPDGCWEWIGYRDPQGYGQMRTNKRAVSVHVFSYELHHGPLPPGHIVCHNCPEKDNPSCVRPSHLWAGTRSQNYWDAVTKGDVQCYYSSGGTFKQKVTETDMTIICELAKAGISQHNLSKFFHIGTVYVSRIIREHQSKPPKRTIRMRYHHYTNEDIATMLQLHSEGYSERAIAKQFNANHSSIHHFLRGHRPKYLS